MSERPWLMFVKRAPIGGQLPVGADWSVPWSRHAANEDEARRAAWRHFARSLPDENPMSWEIAPLNEGSETTP